MIRREYSYIIAAVIWSIPGINITVKGVKSYLLMSPDELWWLLSITAIVAVFFYFIFSRVVGKYVKRIASLPDRVAIWQIYPLKGWVLMVLMMGMGITLKYIPGIPMSFIASFYSGLGPMLLVAAMRFAATGFLK